MVKQTPHKDRMQAQAVLLLYRGLPNRSAPCGRFMHSAKKTTAQLRHNLCAVLP